MLVLVAACELEVGSVGRVGWERMRAWFWRLRGACARMTWLQGGIGRARGGGYVV